MARPESVAGAVLEFCEAALAGHPQRVGKPLVGPLAACTRYRRTWHSAACFLGFGGQVVGVVLGGEVGHDVADQLAVGGVVDVLAGRGQPGPAERMTESISTSARRLRTSQSTL